MRNVEAILAQYETKTLKAKLREFPALIQAAKTRFNAVRQTVEQARADRQTVEAELALAISADVDEKGKARFGNAEQRATELTIRKARDTNHKDAEFVCRKTESVLAEAQANLERLSDEFKAYRYVTRLVAAELALLADDDDDHVDNGDNGEPF